MKTARVIGSFLNRYVLCSQRYLLKIFFTGVVVFAVFRCILLYNNLQTLQTIPARTVLQSLLMGWRFDTVISGYFLVLPLLVLTIAELSGWLNRKLLLGVHIFLCITYIVGFLCCATDIPFFQNFNTRLNVTILNWTGSPTFMFRMVMEEKSYLIYILLFIFLSILFILFLRKIYRSCVNTMQTGFYKRNLLLPKIAVSLLLTGILFLGVRGRIDEKSPIVVGTAYFSKYDLANQAGLNPVFTFMRSYLDSKKEENHPIQLMDEQEAIRLTQQYLNIQQPQAFSPIAREVRSMQPPAQYNVVLVMMESMSANFMERYGEKRRLTPHLDSLIKIGYVFDHFYSAGIHTFNGIFSNLYSFPALFTAHTMKNAVIPSYTGLPWLMKQHGYETIYFTTHDDQFDNVGGFLRANHFNRIISKEDYPSSQLLSTLGVPDHFMFEFSLPILNKYHAEGKPFFVTFMTTSNHPPFIIPEDISFAPAHRDVRDGCVEYADWAIGRFINQVSKQPWFNNTIFIFVGDHGAPANDMAGDLSYSYNHIPFIIYSPSFTVPKIISTAGGQMDIYPTVAGLLHWSYINNTMGMDLLNEKRRWICFGADDKLAVADSDYLYLWHKSGAENLYKLKDKTIDVLSLKRTLADSMKKYGFSTVQTTQWMLLNKKTGAPKAN